MPKKSPTKRTSNRPTRQTGRSRSTKTRQGRQKHSGSQMHRSDEHMNMEEE